eukprot:3146725-Pyramimonas_sp.AAC.1
MCIYTHIQKYVSNFWREGGGRGGMNRTKRAGRSREAGGKSSVARVASVRFTFSGTDGVAA